MSLHLALVVASSLAASDGDAVERRVGDWTVLTTAELRMASVVNDAGASAGILCGAGPDDCVAYIVTTGSCTDGDSIPMMLNSPVGSGAITTTCRHLPGDASGDVTAMNVVEEFGTLREAFESGGQVGIAIPMASGAFRVLRFSTAGATAAIRQAMTPAPATRVDPASRVRDMQEL